MYLDSITISALIDEFSETILIGRVQDVIDVDASGFGFEIYANRHRHYLYMSADKQLPRVHLVSDKLRRGLFQPTQLGLLLRRYIEGAQLVKLYQPPWERILMFDFEHPQEGFSRIVVEPMERRSNILLIRANDIILDCVHRVGPEDNSYRLSLPNHEYKLPPPMDGRIDPYALTAVQLEHEFALVENPTREKANRLLSRRLLGISPLLARELLYRACGNADASVDRVDPQILSELIQDVFIAFKERDWRPGVVGDDATAYSVYPITHLPDWKSQPSISEAMVAYYGISVGADAYNEAKKSVQVAIDEAKIRYGSKLESLEFSLKDQSELEFLQQSGELILAYQYVIKSGQTELRAQYDMDAPELVIKIDPTLTPLENAQRYFDRYNRAKRAHLNVPELVKSTRNELNYILQLESDLEMASNWPEIDDVIQALQQRGFSVHHKAKRLGGSARTGPLKLTKDGYVVWVGRNSRQNEQVTFKNANPEDFWLHARDVPGAHAVVRFDGRRIPDSLIEQVASIVAYYSANRNEAKVIVDITRCKYVKPIKGAGPGMVTYRNETTLTVQPHNEEILKDG